MTRIDPKQERARLAAHYSTMSDLELQKVGRDPEALTPWAREALSDEMNKRGLEWKSQPRVVREIPEDEILVRLGDYPDRNAAALDRDFLAKAGLKTFLYAQQESAVDSPSVAKPKQHTLLLIREKDAVSARQQLTSKREMEGFVEDTSGPLYLDEPTVIRRYRDLPAAYIEKSLLENAGMECFLQDSNIVRMDWFWSNAMGGIKLVVRQKDAEEALKILEEAKSIDPENPETPA